MTKEEAIEELKMIEDCWDVNNYGHEMTQDEKQDNDTIIALEIAIEALNQGPKWIPVNDPLKELPKNRPLLVTVESRYSYRYVTELCYDMTEWSDIDAAKNAIAYQYKPELPEPYKEE